MGGNNDGRVGEARVQENLENNCQARWATQLLKGTMKYGTYIDVRYGFLSFKHVQVKQCIHILKENRKKNNTTHGIHKIYPGNPSPRKPT